MTSSSGRGCTTPIFALHEPFRHFRDAISARSSMNRATTATSAPHGDPLHHEPLAAPDERGVADAVAGSTGRAMTKALAKAQSSPSPAADSSRVSAAIG